MKNNNIIAAIAGIICYLGLAGTAFAAYNLTWYVVGSGGGPSSSSSYAMQSTVGQPVIGHAKLNYDMGSGFWYGIGSLDAGPVVYVQPSYQIAVIGYNFTVDIMVDPKNASVFAAEYKLRFDTGKLEALSQTQGPFLAQDGQSSSVVVNTWDNSAGLLQYGETRIATSTGVNTPGVLSTIKFRVKNTATGGDTTLNLSDAILSDPTPAPMPDVMEKDGTVNITTDKPPVSDCGPDKLKCENVGAPVQFNGSASYDPDGSIVSYAWEFGDSTTGTGVAPKHTYTTYKWNGTTYLPFAVNLTVTDNAGISNRSSQKVVIWVAGDANGDGKVNILDAAVVGLKWGTNDACADLNNDGKVNIIDAAITGLNWGKTA